ncbi:MAG: hypothetical protein CO113_12025 [Elusimicrobia bacterium CG_4_9_14_3_um_filter_62_55]|nr:MAG: hypothetical protein COR54_18735 [Elusimicrobia bacterium CG22_combo_CG10-13_8_21_14_all_63_91]PJA17687.1 MAG: hypothetical protein COX66_03675 [Elusimicrobia bacterium CG_4_10_14_0_2_um_filter_63_34]PJB24767.1 MAG: hypothetical protein CO113_12025 [Elusimicrobia bacterium CG_4_9_14_3_um_filter_62_55]
MNSGGLPPGTLGAAALFWGVQAGVMPWAIPAAAALEAPRLFKKRWALGREDFNRLSDLCAALFGVMVVFLYATREAPEAILTIFRFAPFTLLPLVFGQLYSERGRVDLSAFFLFLRRAAERDGLNWEIDLGPVFLAQMLLGAASGNRQDAYFMAGSAALIAAALWSARPARIGPARWLGGWCAATLLGLSVLGAMRFARARLYGSLLEWSLAKMGPRVDPSRTNTAIGKIGRIQNSDAIALRVFPGRKDGVVPPLLRDALYDIYASEKWFASRPDFARLDASEPIGTWRLAGVEPSGEIVVAKPMENGSGILSLPYGSARIAGLPAEAVERSRFGVVRVTGGPGLATVRVGVAPDLAEEAPPSEADLRLPDEEADALARIAGEWGLRGVAAEAAVDALLARFESDFRYSVYREGRVPDRPLEDFLTLRKRGHCEYFASAAALLLRASGIPARYATGFAVRERGRFEPGFVVRGRHAHAWTRAFVNGRWRTVDATPASWWGVENQRRSGLRPLWDAFSWLRYRWSSWRWRPVEEKRGIPAWVWVLAGVAGFIVWRNFRDWRPRSAGVLPSAQKTPPQGLDSELFAVEAAFAARGLGRRPDESLNAWCRRRGGDEGSQDWRRAGSLHERLRFDPRGLAGAERAELSAAAARLLRETSVSH